MAYYYFVPVKVILISRIHESLMQGSDKGLLWNKPQLRDFQTWTEREPGLTEPRKLTLTELNLWISFFSLCLFAVLSHFSQQNRFPCLCITLKWHKMPAALTPKYIISLTSCTGWLYSMLLKFWRVITWLALVPPVNASSACPWCDYPNGNGNV